MALTKVCFEGPTPSATGPVPLECSAATLLTSCRVQKQENKKVSNGEWYITREKEKLIRIMFLLQAYNCSNKNQ